MPSEPLVNGDSEGFLQESREESLMPADAYYPSDPFRRFFFIGGRLEVAGVETTTPGEPGEVFDFELFSRGVRESDLARESFESLLELGWAKGFVQGTGSKRKAEVRFSSDETARGGALSALREWAATEGIELAEAESPE